MKHFVLANNLQKEIVFLNFYYDMFNLQIYKSLTLMKIYLGNRRAISTVTISLSVYF